ncbi:unnamed protein product, partial [Trichogramma brassicae]
MRPCCDDIAIECVATPRPRLRPESSRSSCEFAPSTTVTQACTTFFASYRTEICMSRMCSSRGRDIYDVFTTMYYTHRENAPGEEYFCRFETNIFIINAVRAELREKELSSVVSRGKIFRYFRARAAAAGDHRHCTRSITLAPPTHTYYYETSAQSVLRLHVLCSPLVSSAYLLHRTRKYMIVVNFYSVIFVTSRLHKKVTSKFTWMSHNRRKPYECEICHQSFGYHHLLKRHIKRVHEGVIESFECEICHKSYKRKDHLKVHVDGVHNQIKPFKCEICHKSFCLKSRRYDHMKIHQGIKPFKCELCDKSFTKKSKLTAHINIVHDRIKPFECETCHKSFGQNYQLQSHTNIVHNGSKQHECEICHKSYACINHLKSHISVVHNTKPYECDICHKSFGWKNVLRAHIIGVHGNNGTPFKCEICSKSFSRSDVLRVHIKGVHVRSKKFECEICHKSFVVKHNLKNHKNAVHNIGIKPFECKICTKAFGYPSELKKDTSRRYMIKWQPRKLRFLRRHLYIMETLQYAICEIDPYVRAGAMRRENERAQGIAAHISCMAQYAKRNGRCAWCATPDYLPTTPFSRVPAVPSISTRAIPTPARYSRETKSVDDAREIRPTFGASHTSFVW